MTLTPVRIRGKKRNRALITSTIAQVSAKRQKISSASRYLESRKEAVATMPTLQGLPQELLEMIFLHSMNVALPRASPDLGRRLSSRTVCMEFCMRSFFGTVDHKAPIQNRTATSDSTVQSELLSCRFYTWDFFLAYVQKAHNVYIKLRGRGWEKTGVTVPGASYFDGLWPFKFTKITYLGFAEGFQIPEKLLQGPWDEAKTALLYVLVSLSGEIDWENSLAGETAKEGIGEAIQEGNERAVAALSVPLGIASAITNETLRFSILECGCNLNILRHLLFNAQILYSETAKGLNFHDPLIWRWADQEGSEDGKGELVKDMLRRAENFDLEFYTDGETDWSNIVPFPYSGEKFDARTGFDDVVRELLTRLYRNYGRRITRQRRRREPTDGVVGAEEAEQVVVAA